MPLDDLAGEALRGALRVVGRMLVELVFEILLKGTGHVVIRLFRPGKEPGDAACALVGLLVWAGVAAGAFLLHRQMTG
ncbi:hypothetical protein ATCM_11040 [Stenotrophomonas sp. ATCM1_4]|uniref:hypothetical protein n=1 Tax=unclassified Stenotrophomonas TaxID=196198 RepID=UPI00104E83BA|nr:MULTISPECIES: hypothetical protein [unclassified Stenotrophomonas]MBD9534974.1 hypothetical protein [Stenotrophomonas sp. STM01]TDB28150.1 hypothetical protein ATCM_11040 [Stenotrophomonas sp. ATCM1_4]